MHTGALKKNDNFELTAYHDKYIKEHRPAAGRRNRTRFSARVLFLSVLGCCIAMVVLGTALVSVYASISALEVRRGILEKKIEREKQLLQKRKVEFSFLSNPERIRSIASSKLNMMEATQIVFIEIKRQPGTEDEGTILSVVTPLLTSEPDKQVKR